MLNNNVEINVDPRVLSKDMVLTEHMSNLEKLENIMNSLSKISASFGAFYILAFSHLSEITMEDNEKDSNLRKQLVLTHSSYFKSLNSENTSIDMNSLMSYDESRVYLSEIDDYYSVMTSAADLANAYIKLNYDIAGMIKDANIRKWKDRYFKEIESDILRVFNEIDAYRLAMATIFLTDSVEISDLNVKIKTCSDIVDYIKSSFTEIDLFFKEASTIHYQICQNGVDLSNPIPFANVADILGNNAPLVYPNGFNVIEGGAGEDNDLPDDF
jgi:hypothetical protein